MRPTPFAELIEQVAAHTSWPTDLLKAQVEVESSGDPFAFRYESEYFTRYIEDRPTARAYRYGPLAACSYGLLQVLLETAMEMGYDQRPEGLFVPRVGLMWGAKYLQTCLAKVGGTDYHAALSRYNGAGPAAEAYAVRVYRIAGRTA